LESKGKVFITTERDIDDEFKPYQLMVSPDKAHSLMYYATMFVGDSQTMTSEAAVLGTPAVKCNSFAGRLAVPNELEERYGLCYSFLPEQQEAFFAKIEELLTMPDLKGEWQRRRQHLFSEKIDYTSFLVWFVENYPQSRQTIVEQPEFQFQFR
jgi:predicted glycosyltransferase